MKPEDHSLKLIKQHISILKEFAGNNITTIYSYKVYNNIFVEDLHCFLESIKPDSYVLDFGCGRGTTSYILSNLGFKIVGMDVKVEENNQHLSSTVFKYKLQHTIWSSQKKQYGDQADYCLYDGEVLPFQDESFDAVFAYAVLEHVNNLNTVMKEIYRVLKKNGILFIARTPNRYSILEYSAQALKYGYHKIKFRRSEISNLLSKNGFVIDRIELVDFFPCNIPTKFFNAIYQRFSKCLFFAEKIIRKTPINLVSHHFRIISHKS